MGEKECPVAGGVREGFRGGVVGLGSGKIHASAPIFLPVARDSRARDLVSPRSRVEVGRGGY